MTRLISQNIGEPLRGIGPLGFEGSDSNQGIQIFAKVISTAIGVITLVAFIWFIFLLLTGAIGLMSAGGDKTAVEAARKKLTNGVIGLFVVIAGIFIVDFVGGLMGIDILNLAIIINNLAP